MAAVTAKPFSRRDRVFRTYLSNAVQPSDTPIIKPASVTPRTNQKFGQIIARPSIEIPYLSARFNLPITSQLPLAIRDKPHGYVLKDYLDGGDWAKQIPHVEVKSYAE